jgi:hypothetical protein
MVAADAGRGNIPEPCCANGVVWWDGIVIVIINNPRPQGTNNLCVRTERKSGKELINVRNKSFEEEKLRMSGGGRRPGKRACGETE